METREQRARFEGNLGFEAGVVRSRTGIAAALLVAAAVDTVVQLKLGTWFPFLSVMAGMLTLTGAASSTRRSPVLFDGENLHLPSRHGKQRRFASLAELTGATVMHRPRGDLAVTLRAGSRAETTLRGTAAEVTALVGSLGFGKGSARRHDAMRLDFDQLAKWLVLPYALLVVAYVLVAEGQWQNLDAFLRSTVAILLSAPVAMALNAARVDITASRAGLEVTRGRRQRHFSWDEVDSVERAGGELTLVTTDGGRHALLRGALLRDPKELEAEAIALADAITEAKTEHEARAMERAPAAAAVARLARRGRTAEAWISSVTALGTGAATYRDEPLSRVALESALDDATLDADVRAAAALALRVSAGGEAERRIRVAAESADDELKAALETVLEDEPEGVLALRFGRLAAPPARGR
ncbi:MAG: hypothetical protein JWP97_2297 [Labilithrix sp.]|nr:hypothetical protein [Labilithrix sp.]